MGLILGHSVRSYVETDTCYAPVEDAMSRDRFLKFASVVQFDNNMAATGELESDKLWKLRPWLKGFGENLNNNPAGEQQSS